MQATFSDDFYSEEPTSPELFERLPGDTLPPAHPGAYAAATDQEIRQALRDDRSLTAEVPVLSNS